MSFKDPSKNDLNDEINQSQQLATSPSLEHVQSEHILVKGATNNPTALAIQSSPLISLRAVKTTHSGYFGDAESPPMLRIETDYSSPGNSPLPATGKRIVKRSRTISSTLKEKVKIATKIIITTTNISLGP
eukprot:UN21272